jgi:hypothetical protein
MGLEVAGRGAGARRGSVSAMAWRWEPTAGGLGGKKILQDRISYNIVASYFSFTI